MDENQIDDLVLDIDVKGLTDKKVQNVNALAKAITSLNKAVSNVANLERYLVSLGALSKNIKSVVSGTATSKTTGQGQAKLETKEVIDPTAVKTQENLSNAIEKTADAAGDMATQFEKTKKNIKDTDKQTNKSSSSFKKLFESIKRIAIYRTIRTALKEIGQAAKEGLGNLRTEDVALDNTLTNLSKSAISFKNSFGQVLSSILQTIEPIITRLSDSIASIVNKISESKAVLNGQSEYVQILTSDMKEYQEALKETNKELFAFDKFNTLSGDEKKYTGVKKSSVTMTEKEAKTISNSLSAIEILIGSITGAIIALKATKIIDWTKSLTKKVDGLGSSFSLLDTILVTGIIISIWKAVEAFKEGDVKAGILATTIGVTLTAAFIIANRTAIAGLISTLGANFVKLLTNATFATGSFAAGVTSLSFAFVGLGASLAGAILLFQNWDILNNWQKIVGILGTITTAVFGLALAFGAFHSAVTLGIAAAAIVAGIAAIAVSIGTAKAEANKKVQTYASGGVPQVGTMFIAGEAGAEAVYNMSNGRTGVANVEQLQAAFAGALDQRTNVYLDAIYKQMDNQYENNSSRSFTMNDFINTIMPEIDKYNQRRGKF